MEPSLRRVQRPAWRLYRQAPAVRASIQRQSFSAQVHSSPDVSIRITSAHTFHSRIHLSRHRPVSTLADRAKEVTGVQERQEGNLSEPTFVSSEDALSAAKKSTNIILENDAVPTQEDVMSALDTIERAGNYLVKLNNLERPQPTADVDNATSALFSLATRHASRSTSKANPESAPVRRMIDALSNLAYVIAVHAPVFLSPQILAKYVDVQVLLLRPDTLPEIFDWYSHKPSPSGSKTDPGEVTYDTPDPKAIAAAIDSRVANRALDAAIHIRNLPLALNIIETTFRAPSFGRAKLFKQATPPIVGAALAPVAAWTLASQLAESQTGLAPETFQQVAFAGMVTYMGCVGTIGYVALTTANDQMQRVTWATGMPLRIRWLREDERAALDRVAQAWGFREKGKWGEEEGEEWEALKEWVGVRGMILDKVGLMEGME